MAVIPFATTSAEVIHWFETLVSLHDDVWRDSYAMWVAHGSYIFGTPSSKPTRKSTPFIRVFYGHTTIEICLMLASLWGYASAIFSAAFCGGKRK